MTTPGALKAKDGYWQYQWTPTVADLANLKTYGTADGEKRHATSIWFENWTGHAAVAEDPISWAQPPMIKVDPITVPEAVQLSVTVTARDAISLKPLSGQVKIDGAPGPSIGAPFTYTFSRKPHRVFDPDTQTSQTVNILPVMSVVVGGYPETQVPLSISPLQIWVEPTAIAVGPPLQVIVHAEDVSTKQPIVGNVKIGNQVLGNTNKAFTYTFSATPPAGIVSATGYADMPVLWPPTHPAQLLVTISPTVTFGTKVRYIVKALELGAKDRNFERIGQHRQ